MPDETNYDRYELNPEVPMTSTTETASSAGSGDFQISEAIMNSLSFEPELPARKIEPTESTLFQDKLVQNQPPSFTNTRRNIRYFASDDPNTGDMISVGGNDFKLSGRAMREICYHLGLRNPKWFRKHFDAAQREEIATNLISKGDDRDFRFFYEQTPSGVFLLNLLPDRKPTISDLAMLTVAEEVLGPGAEALDYKQGQYGLTVNLMSADVKFDANPELVYGGRQVGDIVRLGVQLRNYQTGVASPSVLGYAHRLTCANGAFVQVNQVAWKQEEAVSSGDIAEFIRKGIKAVMEDISSLTENARYAVATPASPMLLSQVVAKYHLNKRHVNAIERAFSKEPGTNIWAYGNAITRAAHEGGFDFTTRTKLENVGGELLFAGGRALVG